MLQTSLLSPPPPLELPTLHDFQVNCVEQIESAIAANHKAIVLVAPTGSGKTFMATELIRRAVAEGRSVLFLVTINCLVDQTIESFNKFALTDFGVICAGYPESDALVQVASIQSLSNRRRHLDRTWDLTLYDEAHTSRWFGIADRIAAASRVVIGLTATPYRLSKRQGFGDKFTHAVLAPSHRELTRMGALAPLKYYLMESADLSGIKSRAGDFQQDDLSRVCNTPNAIRSALNGWEAKALGLRTIAFTVDVAHGVAVTEAFRERGHTAALVTGSTAKSDRREMFGQFEGSNITALVSCDVISTGFDVKNIECGLMMRPTESRTIYIQQVGRVARAALGKSHGIILDAAGNCNSKRFGYLLPEDISDRLTPDNVLEPGIHDEPGEPPMRPCPDCGLLVHISLLICPDCGHEFELPEKEEAVGEFRLMITAADVKAEGKLDDHREFFRRLIVKHWDSGASMSAPYAEYMAAGFRLFPKPKPGWGEGAIYGSEPTDEDLLFYRERAVALQQRKEKPDTWLDWLMKQEFSKVNLARLAALLEGRGSDLEELAKRVGSGTLRFEGVSKPSDIPKLCLIFSSTGDRQCGRDRLCLTICWESGNELDLALIALGYRIVQPPVTWDEDGFSVQEPPDCSQIVPYLDSIVGQTVYSDRRWLLDRSAYDDDDEDDEDSDVPF